MATIMGPPTAPSASEDADLLRSRFEGFVAELNRSISVWTRKNAYHGRKVIEQADPFEDLSYPSPMGRGIARGILDRIERHVYSVNEVVKRQTSNNQLLMGIASTGTPNQLLHARRGDGLSWDEFLVKNESITSRVTSTCPVAYRAGPPTDENHQAAPFKLHQTGTATDHRMEGESPEAAVGTPELESPLISQPDVVHNHLFASASSDGDFPRILRVKGEISGYTFPVLIDSGSTYNILQPRVVQFLNLTTEATSEIPITVGNGASLRCEGQCNEVPLKLNNQQFSLPFMVYPIQGADIVLGVQWLRTLGKVVADFAEPSLSFYWNGVWMKLAGE